MPKATELFAALSSLLPVAVLVAAAILLAVLIVVPFACVLIWRNVGAPPAQRRFVLDALDHLRDLLSVLKRN